MPTQVPNFHDGQFDGIWIHPNKLVQIFLRTADKHAFVLTLLGVEALTITSIKQGNILFDLVFRSGEEMVPSDMAGLYGVAVDSPQSTTLLEKAKKRGLQVLEINPSYGAEGLVLFNGWEIEKREVQSTTM